MPINRSYLKAKKSNLFVRPPEGNFTAWKLLSLEDEQENVPVFGGFSPAAHH